MPILGFSLVEYRTRIGRWLGRNVHSRAFLAMDREYEWTTALERCRPVIDHTTGVAFITTQTG